MTTESSTALARRNDDGAIAVADPFEPSQYHTNANSVISSMIARKMAHVAAFNALGDIDDAPIEAVKECRRAIEDDDDALVDYTKKLNEALLDLSGFKAVIVQMKGAKARIDPLSVRGKFAEMLAALRDREDAEKPAEPCRKRLLLVDCEDSAWRKIESAITKAGVKMGAYVELTRADHIERVGKVIKAVEQERSAAEIKIKEI